ncbi:MAG: (2Fe-2S)-binding protein [Sphingomonas bacterium]|nr:(2Fe-2S)-binding protein [Sphingomonas bacterium]
MIICSCNAIRDSDVRTAARRGCPCPDSAYRSLGCAIQCGSCRDYAAEIIDEERASLLAVRSRAA